MMQGKTWKIGGVVLLGLLLAAILLGAGLGTDYTDGYLVRISSAEAFDFAGVSDDLRREFGGKLGDLRIQHGTENYNDQILIRAQKATEEDAARMTEIAKQDQADAYLRDFSAVKNARGMGKFWKDTLILCLLCAVSAVFLGYRQGLAGALAGLLAALAAMVFAGSLLSLAGVALNEELYLAMGAAGISAAMVLSFMLCDGVGGKAGLASGEEADTLAAKAWQRSKRPAMLFAAALAFVCLAGTILANGGLRSMMLGLLLCTLGAALGTGAFGFPVYLRLAHTRLQWPAAKRKAKKL